MPGRTLRRDRLTVVRGHARWLLGAGTLMAGVLMSVSADAATPPAFAARASIAPALYYIGDSAGSIYTFTVKNTGTTTSIGAVEISRPTGWRVVGCPSGPAGWSRSSSTTMCRYRSAATKSDDLKPGNSATFTVKARTDAGTANRTGLWGVRVSASNQFDNPSLLKTAGSTGSGLTTLAHTFEVTSAVVGDGTPAAGGACPAANKTAVRSTKRTIVVCGRNHASTALTPVSGRSTLGGTLIAVPGTFLSGPVPANSGVVVLASWVATDITSVYGTDKKVIAGIGSASNRTSPLRTFTGYSAISNAAQAAADTFSTAEDTALVVAAPGVLANDTDADGDPITATNASDPANGAVTLNADGSFTYTPDPDFTGTDSFTYSANDTFSDSAPATVTITVTPVADAPVAADDTISTGEDSSLTVPVLGNDTDVDGDTLAVSAVDTTGVLGTVTNTGTAVTYDPNGMFESLRPGQTATETFTYTVSDGALTDTATVTVTITGVNDAPVLADDVATTAEDTPVTVSPLANDSDDEGALAITGVSATNGSAVDNGDGTVTFTPAQDFTGTATVSYTAADLDGASDTATVTITVTPVNDAPVAGDDAENVGEDSSGATLDVLADDTDVDSNPLTVTAVDTTGTTGVVTNNGTDVTYDPNGAFEFLPAGETATDSFTYTVSDGTLTDVATVTVTVGGANDAPVGNDDTYQTLQDTALTEAAPGVLTNDTDVDTGTTKTAGAASDPANGTVTLNADGSFTYTPDSGFVGVDTFTYEVSDGVATDVATVTVTVVPPNATPVATAATGSGLEDGGAITVTLAGDDADGDALTFDAGTATNGLVTVPGSVTCDGNTPSHCTATVTYTPNADYFGGDSFTYTVNDGTADSAPATATMTITLVNDAPSFTKGTDQTVAEDSGAQSVTDWATAIAAGPANEAGQVVTLSATTDNDALFSAVPTINGGGDLTYTPAANAFGIATVSVKASDDGGTADGGVAESAIQTFTITVTAVNDVPVADNDSHTTDEDTNVDIPVLTNDTDADPADVLTVSDLTNTDADAFDGSLAVNPNGTVAYDPGGVFDHLQVGESATETFTYKVSDGNGGEDTATVTVTVNGVNDNPTATPKSHTAIGNTLLTVNDTSTAPHTETTANHLLVGVTDPDDTVFTASGPATTANGANVAVDTDGSFTFLPGQGHTGADTFTFTVNDAHGGTDTDTVTVTVSNMVWYVNAAAGSGGTGRSTEPFSTLAPISTGGTADAKDGTGDHVFVYQGSYTTGLALEGSQKLWGQPHGLTVATIPLVNAGGTNPVISNAAGDAITLANGVDVQRVDAGPSSGVGIKGNSVTSATVGPNTTVNDGVSLTGAATGTISIASTIVNTANQAVAVANRSGGAVTLTGPVTDSGAGIALTSNTGATVDLTGQLTLTTTTNDAFTATGGGTVTAPHASNAITTTGGRGINVVNTNIGAADLVFRSVNVNAAGSAAPANGIVLNNTGSAGGLTVSGTGTAGSGGTIRATTGAGVSLTSTRDVALTHVRVQDSGNDGVVGSGVTNLSLTGVQVLGAGDADNERAVDLTNAGGTLTINGGTYDDAADDLVRVDNTNTNLTASVTNGATFSNQTQVNAGNAFDFVPNGTSAITATINGSTFNNLRNTSVNWGAANAGSSGSSSLTFTNNSVTGGAMGAAGIIVSGQEATTTTTTISNNTFNGAGGNGVVNHDVNDTSTVLATVQGNTLTSPKGHGIVAAVDEDADVRMNITGNTISNAGGDGIELTNFGDDSAAAMTSTAHFIVTNNTINTHSTNPAVAFVGGIAMFHFEADADTTCAKVSGNTVTGTPTPTYFDIFLQNNAGAGAFKYEETPDTALTGEVTESYIQSQNPGTTLANIENIGATYSNGTLCTMP